eukprot:13637662-Ditylum_brightwellii.AAC.1
MSSTDIQQSPQNTERGKGKHRHHRTGYFNPNLPTQEIDAAFWLKAIQENKVSIGTDGLVANRK